MQTTNVETSTVDAGATMDVIGQLYHNASKVQDKVSPNSAVEWFVQTLSAIRRDTGNNQEMLGLTLFHLGKALAYDHRNNAVAIACCEASTDINKRMTQNEYHTDCMYMAASVVEILEDLPAAVRMYQTALDRYRFGGHEQKSRMVQDVLRSMMHRLGERRYRKVKNETKPMNPYRFVIRYNDQAVHRMVVSRDGWVEWHDYMDTFPSLSADTASGWEIVCDEC